MLAGKRMLHTVAFEGYNSEVGIVRFVVWSHLMLSPGSCHGFQLRQRFSIPSMSLLLGRASLDRTISGSALSANHLSKHELALNTTESCMRLVTSAGQNSAFYVPGLSVVAREFHEGCGPFSCVHSLITCTAQGSKAFLMFWSNPTNSSPPF